MRIILPKGNNCSADCPQYDSNANGYIIEYCFLPDGEYKIIIKDSVLVRCPLGEW